MKKIKEKDILQYLQHLLMLLEAGIPLAQASQLLVKQTHHPLKRRLFSEIHHGILSGNAFYKILSEHPEFHPLIIQLCKIGESSGRLIICLKYATDWLEKKIAFQAELKQLIFYPCILFFSSLFLLIILLLKVVPEFSILFKNHLNELPNLTRFIFSLSYLIQHSGLLWVFFGLGTLLSYCLFSKWTFTPPAWLRTFFFGLPIARRYEYYFCISHFTQTLFLSLQAGIPLAQALPACLPPFLSARWENALRPLPHLILTGAPLYQLLAHTQLFTNDVIESIHIGEETRTLPNILKGLSRFYEKQLHLFLKRIATLSEPIIMLGLGLMIGTVIIGLYLPIFKLGNTF